MNILDITSPVPITADDCCDYFDCGEASLNDWLKKKALKNHQSGASRCFVVKARGGAVIGYYALSAGAVSREEIPKSDQRNTPDPIPVLVLGRLAVHHDFHGQGMGRSLLRDALIRCIAVSENAGIFAVIIHALSENAKRFYLSCGFIVCPLDPFLLMMTLKTVRQILTEE